MFTHSVPNKEGQMKKRAASFLRADHSNYHKARQG